MEAVTIEWAVESILGLLRLLWREASAEADTSKVPSQADRSLMELSAQLMHECPGVPAEVSNRIVEKWLGLQRRDDQSRPQSITFNDLCKVLLPAHVHPEDARYFAVRSIRSFYGVPLSSYTAAAGHHFAQTLSIVTKSADPRSMTCGTLKTAVMERLEAGAYKDVAPRIFGTFLDLCLVLNLLALTRNRAVSLASECTDAEYLISHLFGVPTHIPGFDALFGGGGLMLTDSPRMGSGTSQFSMDSTKMIGGRSVLCIGPFGSGKTLLSLQFAVEVARKGGVAWVITFEQTEEECLYALEAIGVTTRHPAFKVVRGGLTDSFLALSHPSPTQGALVFLRPTEQPADYPTFLENTEKRLSWMSQYPLRLLVVDPVNAFIQPVDSMDTLRFATRRMFECAKRANVNIWFTSEQVTDKPESNRFEENIADTVIHLGSESALGQQRRYIEVTKSRFQQEATGRHSLVIDSPGGMIIQPSSTLIASLVSSNVPKMLDVPLSLGIPGIERLLGSEPIRPGDLIVLAGPGKGKTLMGAYFLLAGGNDDPEGSRSLFISDNSPTRMDRLLSTVAGAEWQAVSQKIDRCSLPTGYVDPGRILQEIQAALERCQAQSEGTTRVLLTNLSRWEEEMPFVTADPSFGIALVKLLRGYNTAVMVVCGDTLERGSRLRDTMIDQADVFLQFHREEFQGRVTTLISAVKSRFMRHQRESFELCLDSAGVRVRPAPLFRIRPSGDIVPVRISLFLHAETDNHKKLNDRIIEGLRATISPDADIEPQDRRFDPSLLSMSQYSAIDELQIFQIDEFQLPTCPAAVLPASALYSFDTRLNEGLLADRVPELANRVYCKGRDRFLAVPFYANLSFFAVHQNRFEAVKKDLHGERFPESWTELADLSEQFEARHSASSELFFSCAIYDEGIETYNCLFFEILHSLQRPADIDFNDLSHWLNQPAAMQAARLFRQLCKRSHQAGYDRARRQDAIITRHWYNTLNQALSEMSPQERMEIGVRPLFDGFTTAGEWYLAIPSHSASPEIGLRLIEHLTAPDRETSRVELGVGLPTRTAYFQSADTAETSISRYFRFSRAEVYRLLQKAIRRSDFRFYQRFSGTMSSHLQWLLEIPDPQDETPDGLNAVQSEIERILKGLASIIHFLSETATVAKSS